MRHYRNNGPSIVTRIKNMNQWQLAELKQLQKTAREHADQVAPIDTSKSDKISEIVKELS